MIFPAILPAILAVGGLACSTPTQRPLPRGAQARTSRVPPRGLPAGPPTAPRLGLLRGAIDAHLHLGNERAAATLLEALRAAQLRWVVVVGSGRRVFDAGGGLYEGLAAQNALLLRLAARYPDRLRVLVGLDPADPTHQRSLPDWIRRGARGLKLYAGHASYHRGPLDRLLAPTLALAERQHLPVMLHVNGIRFGDELDRLLRRFPRLRLLCPHFCLLLDDLPRLERLLATHPRLWIDTSLGAYAHQGFALAGRHAATLRRLLLAHPRRVVFGSDAVVDGLGSASSLAVRWRAQAAQLFARRFTFEGRGYRGLALPASLRRPIMLDNARRWLLGSLKDGAR